MERYCCCPVPQYLQEWQGFGSLILLWLLILMGTQEPVFWCLGGDELFTTACAEGLARRRIYSVFSSYLSQTNNETLALADGTVCSCFASGLAMMLFWALLVNMSVFSMCPDSDQKQFELTSAFSLQQRCLRLHLATGDRRISAFILVCGRVLSEVDLRSHVLNGFQLSGSLC